MAGIYIHIPFCKQACHYCNFHFATSIRFKEELVRSIVKEIEIRNAYAGHEIVDTIYFGGGTPSLLSKDELVSILLRIKDYHKIAVDAEISFEVNPDDINEESLKNWKEAGINRLSIGVQSFFNEDLEWMNRAHSASEAVGSLQLAVGSFQNISIDLIYGIPQLTNEKWESNVEKAISFGISHISAYALTVEPKTPLYKMIREHKSENINPDKQSEQFLLLMQWMKEAGYEHYEISNYARTGMRSRHNSSYWQGKKYIGIGPSAHSFNGAERQWNISNNKLYVDAIEKGLIPSEKEILTTVQRLNEYIMTSLRTIEGIQLDKLDAAAKEKLLEESEKYIYSGLMRIGKDSLILTREGKLLADGIASELFF